MILESPLLGLFKIVLFMDCSSPQSTGCSIRPPRDINRLEQWDRPPSRPHIPTRYSNPSTSYARSLSAEHPGKKLVQRPAELSKRFSFSGCGDVHLSSMKRKRKEHTKIIVGDEGRKSAGGMGFFHRGGLSKTSSPPFHGNQRKHMLFWWGNHRQNHKDNLKP